GAPWPPVRSCAASAQRTSDRSQLRGSHRYQQIGGSTQGPRLFGHLASFTSSWPLKDRIGSRFRLPSMDRRHPSSLWAWAHAFFRAFVSAAKALSGAYEEGIAGMLTIIKASLLGSALMLLESCTGYLTTTYLKIAACCRSDINVE